MPRNTTGGNKHKKKKRDRSTVNISSSTLPFAKDDNVYGLVINRLGGTRVSLECSDGISRHGVIPGKFYKKVYIKKGDIVLCQLEGLNNQPICYILYKYNEKEKKILKSKSEISFLEEVCEEEEDMIEFSDNEDEYEPSYQENQNKPFDLDNNHNLNDEEINNVTLDEI